MKIKLDSLHYETVLSYCIDRTLSGYDHAVNYGQLNGFFTCDNELTPVGKKIANILTSKKST